MRGVLGLLPGPNPAEPGGCGGPISSATEGPNICDNVPMSGGGIGYIPKLISSSDRPRDHKSLATEYWEPCLQKHYIFIAYDTIRNEEYSGRDKQKINIFCIYL